MDNTIESNNKIKYSSLQNMIDILEDLNDKEKKSYNSLVKDLLGTFGLKITVEEIREFYEPNLEEVKMDLEMQINNVC